MGGEDLARLTDWLGRRAENVAALLLAVMFVAFLVQIVARYAFNFPLGWTSELTLVTWLWLVLFGASCVITEQEEVRFDLIYGAMGPRARLATAVLTHVFTIAVYAMSFPAVIDYVTFMKVQKTTYFDIPFSVLFFIYPVFAAATILRYAAMLWQAVRNGARPPADPTEASTRL